MFIKSFKHYSQKILQGLFLSCFAAGLSHAQTGSSAVENGTNIDQTGEDNIAAIASRENNEARITQSGSGNRATITINGEANGERDGRVDQSGENNTTILSIDGDDNSFVVDQSGDGARNRAVLSQEGSFNDLNILQDALGLTTGNANLAEVSQIGTANTAVVSQTAIASAENIFSNEVLINQNGDGNLATVNQFGQNNSSEQEQIGNDNSSNVIQNGDNNNIIHRQFGDNLSVPGEFGGITIEQTSGATIIIEQYSADVAPIPQ